MNVLVTGGAGFIGSHLAERLVNDGHAVTVLDNESTGRPENAPPAARYVKGDVTRPGDLEPAFAGDLDAVCHIAGQVSLIRSFTDPVTDLRTNVEGTVNVLEAARVNGARRRELSDQRAQLSAGVRLGARGNQEARGRHER